MSPKVAIMYLPLIVPSAARVTTLSTSSREVTQTGHPGPEMSRIPGGRRFLIPDFEMETVWVPHTYIKEIA